MAFDRLVSSNFFLAINFTLFVAFPKESSFAMNYSEVADAVSSKAPFEIAYAIARSNLSSSISEDLNSLVLKYMTSHPVQEISDEELEEFTDRVDGLINLVVTSVLKNQNKEEALDTWKSVAYELLLFNDLFGYVCVTCGLGSTQLKDLVKIDENDSIDLMIFRHYVRERSERHEYGVAGTILHEHGHVVSSIDG